MKIEFEIKKVKLTQYWLYKVYVGAELLEFYLDIEDDVLAHNHLTQEIINTVSEVNAVHYFPETFVNKNFTAGRLFKLAFKKLFTEKEPIDE
jgi:hypothetical protein